MISLIVVNNIQSWPLHIPGCEIVNARTYLTDERYSALRGARVFNLCRSYRYQSVGYYVSLLAMARGHKPLPSVSTIQEMKSTPIVRLASDELDEQIQDSLKPIQSEEFTLSIYFGKNLARRYDRLAAHLFKVFQAPFLRAEFEHDGKWHLRNIRPISGNEIPEAHYPFVIQATNDYFENRGLNVPKRFVPRYDLAILYDPAQEMPPSNEKAMYKFVKAARKLELGAEFVTKDDYGSVPQYDALFIRETTYVTNHTYRFARRAYAEGLVVIDDPASIEKCTNKVYLAELLERYGVPRPKTLIVHKDNVDDIVTQIGLPCVLKQPDSSFSRGVFKVETEDSMREQVNRLLDESELIIAQEFLPTPFDWRVGILDRQPLYVCKYFMARRHWQIQKSCPGGNTDYGRVETLPVETAPPRVINTAMKAANLIGDGLYGVDLKEIGRKPYVIEVNDNPSIDSGIEDDVLKDDLYNRIMGVFLKRIEQRKEARPRR
ncbi:MAG: RimK family protein [FCB group bacterium]|nr:RimK family protein [FCB group bacterium]